jgi:hypothetical protein
MKKSQGPIWKRIEREKKVLKFFFFFGWKNKKKFHPKILPKLINFNSLRPSYQLYPTQFGPAYPDQHDMKFPCDSELLSLSPDKCIFLTNFFCHEKIIILNFFKISIIITIYIDKTVFIIDSNNCITL